MSDREILVGIANEMSHVKKEIVELKNQIIDTRKANKELIMENAGEIQKLKSWKDKVNGALGIISLVVTTLIGFITRLIK